MRKRMIAGLLAALMCFLPTTQAASAYVYAMGQPGPEGFLEEKGDTLSANSVSLEKPGNADMGKEQEAPSEVGSAVETEGVAGQETEAETETNGDAGDEEGDSSLSGPNLESDATLSGNRMAEDTVTLTADYDGIRVAVTGSAKALPEGCSLEVSALASEDLMLYATGIYDTEVVENGHVAFDCLSGYDITILDVDGNVIEPGEEVQVTIENAVDPPSIPPATASGPIWSAI